MDQEALLQQFLLRTILRRFGVVKPVGGRLASPDLARQARATESSPELLRLSCDAWDIPLGELARSAGLEQTVLSQYVMGSRKLSWEEQKAVVKEMNAMVGRVDGG